MRGRRKWRGRQAASCHAAPHRAAPRRATPRHAAVETNRANLAAPRGPTAKNSRGHD